MAVQSKFNEMPAGWNMAIFMACRSSGSECCCLLTAFSCHHRKHWAIH